MRSPPEPGILPGAGTPRWQVGQLGDVRCNARRLVPREQLRRRSSGSSSKAAGGRNRKLRAIRELMDAITNEAAASKKMQFLLSCLTPTDFVFLRQNVAGCCNLPGIFRFRRR